MDARLRTIWIRGTLVAAFALALPLTSGAQPPPQPPGTPLEPYTPADGAKDLRSVLFNWTRNMGMLKGTDEREMVATLEYQGTGTIQVDGQPCAVTKLRTSTNYQTFSQRINYTCTRSGQVHSNIEVVSGLYAWDEDTPGATIAGTPGKVTPKPDAVQERLIRLWASPQGAPKAAIAGIDDTFWLGANPGTLLEDGAAKVGETSVEWQGDKPVVTFPLPGVPGATATATLTPIFLTERVVVRQGSTTTEFAYGDYKDWNNELNLIEVLYAGKLVERRNGNVVRDLTTKETETGNVYVVAPVPEAVRAAIRPREQMPVGVMAKVDPPVDKAAPTPRLGDRPDLSGSWQWTDWIGNYMGGGGRRCAPNQLEGCSRQVNQTYDFELYSPSRFGNTGRPLYKPEHWDKVIALDMWTNKEDPVMTCQPLGVPRQGPPRRIYQTDKDVTFIYLGGDAGGGYGEYRIIPTDGRERDERQARETRYLGYTIGRWEGDTLVLEAGSFNDFTWLGRGGFFHSEEMVVTERFTRQGDAILYDVTVEDPEVLAEPWVIPTRTLRLNTAADAGLLRERGNCETYEDEDIVTQIRH